MELKHTKSYHQGHPNPQCYRENFELLDGEWDFIFDEEDVGLLANYPKSFPNDYQKIIVPYPYQSPASGINSKKLCDYIWYRKFLHIRDISLVNRITFLGVDYEASVYVNGKFVCKHFGGYDAFTVDISPYCFTGDNELILRVEDKMHADQFRGKQKWRDDNFGCWYTETSGIINSVYLERLNPIHIKSFALHGDYKKKILLVDVDVETPSSSTIIINVEGFDHQFGVHQGENHITIPFNNVIPWEADDPYLYDVTLTLMNNNIVVDKVDSYFGFVNYEIKDKHFYINDKDTYLKFVLNQGYYGDTITTFDEQKAINDMLYSKEIGLNGMRLHEKVEPPLYFYYLDIIGLYAWQEVPSAYSYSSYLKKHYYAQADGQIKEHISHPCIMAYVLFNESWGIQDIIESEESQRFTVEAYNYFKPKVYDRFLITNDGWEHTCSDILTIHNYSETYEDLKKQYDSAFKEVYENGNPFSIDYFKRFFVGNFRYNNTPIMMSEFAGIAFNKDVKGNSWGYGKGVNNEEDYLAKYGSQLKYLLERSDMRGFCMTQLTDVEQEVNGLLTYDRREKINKKRLKELHDQFK